MRRDYIQTLLLVVFLLFGVSFFTLPVYSQSNTQSVIINEITWMGSTNSSSDEWIELYNTTNQTIDLTGWRVLWEGAEITLAGLLNPEDYYLLERTDDSSVPSVAADQIYTGALGNSGEDIVLLNSLDDEIDSARFSSGWPSGDNENKLTMERLCPIANGDLADSWGNSQQVDGTPKTGNFGCDIKCYSQEVSRSCVADGYSEILYSYNEISCGLDYIVVQDDSNCLCQYSQWQAGECVGNETREYNRSELSGHNYCQELLTKQELDNSCSFGRSGRGRMCYIHNRVWQCHKSIINFDDDKVSFIINSEGNEYNVTKKIENASYLIIKAKHNKHRLTLILNKKNSNILMITRGVWFRGKLFNS